MKKKAIQVKNTVLKITHPVIVFKNIYAVVLYH